MKSVSGNMHIYQRLTCSHVNENQRGRWLQTLSDCFKADKNFTSHPKLSVWKLFKQYSCGCQPFVWFGHKYNRKCIVFDCNLNGLKVQVSPAVFLVSEQLPFPSPLAPLLCSYLALVGQIPKFPLINEYWGCFIPINPRLSTLRQLISH